MKSWASILTLTLGTDGRAVLSALRADRTLPQENFLVVISVRG